jgi:hypothetical protein
MLLRISWLPTIPTKEEEEQNQASEQGTCESAPNSDSDGSSIGDVSRC